MNEGDLEQLIKEKFPKSKFINKDGTYYIYVNFKKLLNYKHITNSREYEDMTDYYVFTLGLNTDKPGNRKFKTYWVEILSFDYFFPGIVKRFIERYKNKYFSDFNIQLIYDEKKLLDYTKQCDKYNDIPLLYVDYDPQPVMDRRLKKRILKQQNKKQ